MALHWQAVVLLLLHLHSTCFVNTSPVLNENEAQNLHDSYRPQIQSVIDHLNADPDRHHQYQFSVSQLLDAQKTDDITFIEIEVDAKCIAYTGCPNAVFTCKANVELIDNIYKPKQSVVDCQRHQVIEPEPVSETSSTPVSILPINQKSEYCPGCTVDLDINIPGVENLITTALHHLEAEKPKKHVSVKVLRLQREIVSGVKFILLLEVAPTVCDAHQVENPLMCPIDSQLGTEICRIEYIQKPWISDDKHIIANNCTGETAQDFAAVSIKKSRNDFDNEIDVNNEYKKSAEMPEVVPDSPNYEKMAETGNLEPEISPARLLDLDSQIIPTNPTEQLVNSQSVIEVETTKFGMDNSQMAVEDVPSLPTSTDSFVLETIKPVKEVSDDQGTTTQTDDSQSHEGHDSTESSESVEERSKRQTTTQGSSESSEESSEGTTKKVEVIATEQTETLTKTETETTNRTETIQTRRKRSDDSSDSSDSSDSDEKHKKRKHKKYYEKTSPCDDAGNVDCPYKKTHNVEPPVYEAQYKCNNDDPEQTNCVYQRTKTIIKKCDNGGCAQKQQEQKPVKCKNKKKSSSSSSSSDSDDDECNRRKRNAEVEPYLVEKQLVDDLAKFAAESLDNETWKHEVIEVINVKKLELEGAVYRMMVRFAATRCNEIGECYPFEHDKLCKLTIHYSHNNAKLLKSRCHQIERDVDKNRSTQRMKRQVLGGQDDALNDPEILDMTKETLLLLDTKSSHEHKYKIEKIHKATKQVVAGQLFRITADIVLSDCLKNDNKDSALCGKQNDAVVKNCKIVIVNQAWLPNGKQTNVTCDKDEYHAFRSKRSVDLRLKRGIPGAPVDATSDPDMQVVAVETLRQLDTTSSHDNKLKVLKIHSASKQVVAGVLYKLEVDIAESDCPKNDNKESTLCGVKKEAAVRTCLITVWDRPWLPNGKETNCTCGDEHHTFRSKRSLPLQLTFPWMKPLVDKINQFETFKKEHNKVYATVEEEQYRFGIFLDNMKKAAILQKNEQGSATYGATKFADLNEAEFKQYLGYRPELREENDIPMAQAKIPNMELPTEFDWRTKNAVTEVKDQGQCGSCWAFSVTGNVEGQYAIKHSKLLEFSEQELVDCDKMDEGCNGGLMDNAYRAIEQLGGLELESDYPYDAEDESCKFKPSKTRVQLSGAVNVSSNEDDMAKFLVKNGPISIAINANAMQLYRGGVSHPYKFLCDPSNLDHGVLIVGYGVHEYKLFKKTLPYWIVKNSWGPSWGEQGYYRVYRGDGTCGVNKMASSAIVE